MTAAVWLLLLLIFRIESATKFCLRLSRTQLQSPFLWAVIMIVWGLLLPYTSPTTKHGLWPHKVYKKINTLSINGKTFPSSFTTGCLQISIGFKSNQIEFCKISRAMVSPMWYFQSGSIFCQLYNFLLHHLNISKLYFTNHFHF